MAARGLDYFTLELHTPAGQPLPSVPYEGETWFVGEPGQEFVARVDVINNSHKMYRISLLVDGTSVGYSFIVFGDERSTRHTFKGWLQQTGQVSGSCTTHYRHFKFGSIQHSEAAATVRDVDEIPAGKVELQLEEVYDTGRQTAAVDLKVAGPTQAAADKKLPEGKKWFLAPGLKAEAGSVTASQTTWNTKIYNTVAKLESIKVRFDCSQSLLLRKVLNPKSAAHRVILRKSANPSVRVAGAEPGTGNGAAANEATSRPSSSSRARGARVKQEAGTRVKRERQAADEEDEEEEEYVPRSATAAERVDLTEEPVLPMTINGRRLAADELAVCDLCDSDDDDAAHKWHVQKKQQMTVEL